MSGLEINNLDKPRPRAAERAPVRPHARTRAKVEVPPDLARPESDPEQVDALRAQLVRRLGVAASVVAVLLGALAFFDYLATQEEDDDRPVFTRPVPVGRPGQALSQPIQPMAPATPEEAAAPEVKPVVPPEAAESEKGASSVPEVPESRPTDEVVPAPKVAGSGQHVTRGGRGERSASPVLSESKSLPRAPASRASEGVPVWNVQPVSPGRQGAGRSPQVAREWPSEMPAPREHTAAPAMILPPRRAEEAAQAPARVLSTRPGAGRDEGEPGMVRRLFSGFLLQAGSFSSPQRAEEIHAMLALSGVPSSLETRVQVGPFRTRREAELAQQKLREMGIQAVLVPPQGQH